MSSAYKIVRFIEEKLKCFTKCMCVGVKVLLLASLNISMRRYMYYSICRQKENPKVKKEKLCQSGRNPHQALRYITSLVSLKTVHCVFITKSNKVLLGVDPICDIIKKIKKQAYTPHMQKNKKSLFAYLNSNEKKFKARC